MDRLERLGRESKYDSMVKPPCASAMAAGKRRPAYINYTPEGGRKGESMKAVIEISEETMDRLAGALDLPPLYSTEFDIDEHSLSYAIELMVYLCAD
ncbi:MAG: hypothetical protein HDR08_01680 [Lachnospiraceae bacterium]|nr:hypothetical protein [Lachnospiraceae bacterium]